MSEHYVSPVSEIYIPPLPRRVQDEPTSEKYDAWGYSMGYEIGEHNTPYPENGNTAVFRIRPQGMTEPVYVSKPERKATFTVNVLAGSGRLIREKADGVAETIELTQGTEVVIRPKEAYVYKNDGNEDLVLYDVALPAFRTGDDIELISSPIRPPKSQRYDTYLVESSAGQPTTVYTRHLSQEFFDLIGEAASTA